MKLVKDTEAKVLENKYKDRFKHYTEKFSLLGSCIKKDKNIKAIIFDLGFWIEPLPGHGAWLAHAFDPSSYSRLRGPAQ